MTERPKDRFIEVWRGIAVLLVVWFHFTGRLPPSAFGVSEGASLPFHSGKVGVLIFFVISGFLIAKSIDGCRTLAEFTAKRLSRIWPLFIAASLVTFAVLAVVPTVPDGGSPYFREGRSWWDLVSTVLFLEDVTGEWIDGAFWSILVELKFYLWFGVVAALVPGRFVTVFALVALVLSGLQTALIVTMPGEAATAIRVMNGVFVAGYLPFFALGALLHRGDRGPLLSAHILLVAILTLFSIADEPLFDLAATVRFLLVLGAVVALDGLLARHRLFALLGRYSYGWYLVHQVLGMILIEALAGRIGYDLATATALLVTFALALSLSRAVEWRFRPAVQLALTRLFTVARPIPLGRGSVGRAPNNHPPSARP